MMLQDRVNKQKKSILIQTIIFFLIGSFFAVHLAKAATVEITIDTLPMVIEQMFTNINTDPFSVKENIGVIWIVALGCLCSYVMRIEKIKRLMPKDGYGSSRWANDKEIKRLAKGKNLLLADNVKLSTNTRYTKINNNVMVLGTSGSGKTRFYVKPNMMESAQKKVFSGMIITDPKKELCIETADMMKKHGYNIKIFDVKDFSGDCWNPFDYFYDDTDVISFVKSLMANTDGEGKKGEAFWDNASMFLFNAVIFYLIEKCPPSDRNLVNVKRLIKLAIVDEENADFQSPLDNLFNDLERENPKSKAVDNYRSFKLAGGKTLKSIIISCISRLYFVGFEKIDNMLSKDEIKIDTIGYEKTVLYIVISDTDSTYNFLAGMFIDQLFKVLVHKADKTRKKPFIHFFLDEFANIGKLNYFCEKLSTIRSRNISATVILQNLQQLEKLYEKQDKSIIENCNTKLVLATSESAKWVSEKLGAMTIETKTGSKSKGRNKSTSTNEGQMKRNLLDPNEVEQLDKTKCIIMTQGNYPILATKYDITKHKLYKELGDVNENSKNNYEHVKEKKQFEKLTFEDLIESANLEIDGAINELEEEYESLI